MNSKHLLIHLGIAPKSPQPQRGTVITKLQPQYIDDCKRRYFNKFLSCQAVFEGRTLGHNVECLKDVNYVIIVMDIQISCLKWNVSSKVCCMPGWTSRNTGVYPTLLQRGGKDWMLYTRKIIMIKHRRRQD